jgi:hypothetical protein
MTFPQFVAAVDNLVKTWKIPDDFEHKPETELPSQNVPESVLREIYDSVREQSVYDMAQLEQRRTKETPP